MAEGGRRTGQVDLIGLSLRFGGRTAVDDVSLTIKAGEYFCLQGPPGSGKTSVLRLVSGAEQPSAGRVLLDGEDPTCRPNHRRAVSAIFGGYTLFPFLDVAANVAFGLRHAHGPAGPGRAETSARVRSALAAVQMSEYARRRPPQLSGEQQQRVALARALVVRPRILLLDDPLQAMDERLRPALREDLRAVQRQVGLTVVHTTVDRDEALALADRVAVLRDGRIVRVGTAPEVHAEPTAA
ncbi:ABC transporter [Parafrankia irregularis]|uniref:ABC transporter n=1 Tax=Parafrankia irregularis TaxID=795642 RepID=A0A0S4QRD6_9ACTN|nr:MULTISPECIES: ATP-binding cassette domain-containing protein [Parafrankia]MBE3202690.1 ATP-binding cassette domain-containing protein [Parafrankia sp. CH37]CUU57876.1 ABC transporter [Parafrankia irregularis]